MVEHFLAKENVESSKLFIRSGELTQLVEYLLCKQAVSGSSPLFSIALRGNNLVRTGFRLPDAPLAVVGLTNEDPVGHFVNENHLVSQSHGTTGHKGFRRAGG